MMRIVVHDRRSAPGSFVLESTVHSGESVQRSGNAREVDSERQTDCDRRQSVAHIVKSVHRQLDGAELAERWLPILDAFDEVGVDVCYEIHPGEDLHDGVTFERFLEATGNHRRCNILYDPSHFLLQQLDYVQFIDFYHERIKMFHVKDAEFNPDGRSGMQRDGDAVHRSRW